MEFNEKDLVYSYYDPDERRNGWMQDPKIGVCVKHKPTGLESRCGAHPSKKENTISAVYALRNLVIEAKPTALLVNLDQIEADFNNGIMLCKVTIGNLIKYARSLQKK